MFNVKKNPFFQHAEREAFMVYEGQVPLGRIAAIVDRRHNEFHKDRTGFFGFFECVPHRMDAASALFDAAAAWVRVKEMTLLRGPVNFSMNDECGLLVDGFDRSPYLMMTYNPSYYPAYMDQAGFQKAKDLYAFRLVFDRIPPALERIQKISGRIKARSGVTIRPLDMKNFGKEIDIIKDIYNSSWQHNWGFVPMTNEEMDHFAKKFKPVAVPEILLIAEVKGRPAGVALALPDFNEITKSFNGRIGPLKMLKLLLSKRRTKKGRGFVVGVKEEFRKLGLNALLLLAFYEAGMKMKYEEGEVSWILEDNRLIIDDIESMGATRYKTYRLYDRRIS